MSVGNRLRHLRSLSGKTQGELAKQLYVTASSIGMYERDERTPSTDVLKKYSQLFDVSLDYILGNERLVEDQDYITINVYGSIPAGIPIEAIEEITDTEDLSLKEYDKNKTYLGLKVDGDSLHLHHTNQETSRGVKTTTF